jgi:hypothetical protein
VPDIINKEDFGACLPTYYRFALFTTEDVWKAKKQKQSKDVEPKNKS